MIEAHRFLSKGTVMSFILAIFPVAGHAQVIFLEGGYTEYCANAAHLTDRPEETLVTGSRLSLDPIESCTRAILEEGENRALNYNNRGVIYFSHENYIAAVKDFNEAVRLNKESGQFHFNLGLALLRLQLWEESLAVFNRGLELTGIPSEDTGTFKLAEIYYNRGVAHEESGNIRQAYYDYLRASELAPDWMLPHEELARFSVRQ